ncbi:helix-turn-helix transcriptional regulator [Streptomyces sp. MP131-18]|uniref:helix-turn-helix domain-containing protein n=1 Tax=Streptomyces sp. MP131-18 TaxID=1857892 RepID=UPI00097C4718|nr:helix-turn-helix transcriptional regulator [Streptomyces sp. MP131-18]ONK09506.1 transcriptional regulator, y4mF family [Streptomyces sp. MP131-18]
MDRDWARLAEAIRQARATRGWRQIDLADAAGVTESTIQNLEAGTRTYTRLPQSLKAIERALGWAPGSAVSIVDGGDPTPLSSPEQAPGSVLPVDIPLRVRQELQQGHVVDTEVVDLSRPGSKSTVLVLWKKGDSASAVTAEEVAEWTRIQRAVRGIPDGDTPAT